MSKQRSLSLLMYDILESIRKIQDYVKGMDNAQFLKDDKTKDAVLRNLEIIGEASKNIPESWKQMYPHIAWRGIEGMRNRLIHEYFGVSWKIVWETIHNDLPTLQTEVEKMSKNVP